jgi:hypothetical protein
MGSGSPENDSRPPFPLIPPRNTWPGAYQRPGIATGSDQPEQRKHSSAGQFDVGGFLRTCALFGSKSETAALDGQVLKIDFQTQHAQHRFVQAAARPSRVMDGGSPTAPRMAVFALGLNQPHTQLPVPRAKLGMFRRLLPNGLGNEIVSGGIARRVVESGRDRQRNI